VNFIGVASTAWAGNLRIALSGWRVGLRTEPDEVIAEEVEKEERQITQQPIWVISWDHL